MLIRQSLFNDILKGFPIRFRVWQGLGGIGRREPVGIEHTEGKGMCVRATPVVIVRFNWGVGG